MTPKTLALTDRQVTAFEKELASAVAQLERRIRALIARMEIRGGVIQKTSANLQFAASLTPQLNEMLTEAGYPDIVANFQSGDAELLASVRQTSPIAMNFTQGASTTLTALRAMQNTQFAGIGAAAMESVRQGVVNTIMTGARLEDCLDSVRAQLSSKLRSYAWTYANTTRKDVVQMANDLAAEAYDGEKYWAYNGPLDDVTRPACIALLEIGYFTDAEREQAEADTADERMYNCRHTFDLVPAHVYEKNKG